MHVGIYTLFLYPGQIGGIETYLRQLVAALGRVDRVNRYTLFVGEHNRSLFGKMTFPNIEIVTISTRPSSASLASRVLRKLKLIPGYIAGQLHAHPVDIIHYPGSTIDQPEIRTPCVLTLHDIQQEYFPQFFSPEVLAWRKATFKPSAQKARHIITDSEFTRQTIIERYRVSPAKVHTIHFAVGDTFQPAPTLSTSHIRHKYRLPERFIFFPANPWPHKNHARLFQALRLLEQKYGLSCPLVLSGVFESEQAHLQALLDSAGVAGQVRVLGYVPYEDLPGLYAAAAALVFPSLFEGFGIPVLEAMACGCPVICANTTSLPELAGDAALLIDPLDVAQIAEVIYNVLSSEALSKSLREKGLERVKNFSWEKAARETIKVYESALAQSRSEG